MTAFVDNYPMNARVDLVTILPNGIRIGSTCTIWGHDLAELEKSVISHLAFVKEDAENRDFDIEISGVTYYMDE